MGAPRRCGDLSRGAPADDQVAARCHHFVGGVGGGLFVVYLWGDFVREIL